MLVHPFRFEFFWLRVVPGIRNSARGSLGGGLTTGAWVAEHGVGASGSIVGSAEGGEQAIPQLGDTGATYWVGAAPAG